MTDYRRRELEQLEAAGVTVELDGCPFPDCHLGPAANIYRALVVGPDGRQRVARGCVKHLPWHVDAVLDEIRVEPLNPELDPLDLSPR